MLQRLGSLNPKPLSKTPPNRDRAETHKASKTSPHTIRTDVLRLETRVLARSETYKKDSHFNASGAASGVRKSG